MNKYEAMIIFRESLKDADWDGAVETVRGEIEKLGGTVSSCTRPVSYTHLTLPTIYSV